MRRSNATEVTGSPDIQLATPEGVQQAGPALDLQLVAEVVTSINSVEQEEWDACATGCGEVNPFLLWTFLHCLEESGSAVSPLQGRSHTSLSGSSSFNGDQILWRTCPGCLHL